MTRVQRSSWLVFAGVSCFILLGFRQPTVKQVALGHRSAPLLMEDGLQFKDLNRNGKLDVYEDWRRTPQERAEDLLRQMNLAEKAGVMMHGTAPSAGNPIGIGTAYDAAAVEAIMRDEHVNTFITRLAGDAQGLARENNKLQELAEQQRLGIPVTISTDPRNHFHFTVGATVAPGDFSKWPEPLGLASVGDPAMVKEFADVARREYLAVGIREALSPQADIATEPRWSRIDGTFGDDPELTREMVTAYVEGFQNGADGIHSSSVITVVKHWVGYGAQKEGFDSHNYYGRFGLFTGDHLPMHIVPFQGAFAVHVGGVMPTYSILEDAKLDGTPLEQVGAGYNKQLLSALRNKYGFDGVVVSDWAITKNCDEICTNGFPAGEKVLPTHIGMPWGVAHLSAQDRYAKSINAGVDQVGGTDDSKSVLEAVSAKKISESRVNQAVQRILVQKFQQGLFDNPYVDEKKAGAVVGNASFRTAALNAQRRSLVLLQNKSAVLPLSANGKRVFLYHIDPAVAAQFGLSVVDTPEQADVALLRVAAPYQKLHPQYFFGAMQHEGSLDFGDENEDWAIIQKASAKVPTIVSVYLDRPAILTRVQEKASAILANFGITDEALLDVVTGKAKPEGKLPFELPSSMAEVEAQAGDVPHDTKHPLYRFGFGMSY
jgi:beta-glucosidase